MPYASPTLAAVRLALAAKLQDPANVFWTSAELTMLIQESLRTWNAMAAWYRDRFFFNTTPGTFWYDLTVVPNTLIPQTVTDLALFQSIQSSLLEPTTTGGWLGSEQFTAQDIVTTLQQTRNQFLLETGCVLSPLTPYAGNPLNGRIDVAAIDIRRMAYKDANGLYTLLWRTDENELFAWAQGWLTNPAPVQAYSIIATPPLRVQLAPIPSVPGILDILTVRAGVPLNPATPVVLGVPDDLSWVIKFGALADLLTKDGPPADPFRASYCQQRYQQGVELARATATVMFAYLDGVQVQPVSVFDLDVDPAHARNWQNDAPGAPNTLGVAGMNLIALAPPADAGPHSVTLDVLRNFPVPVADTDIVQVGAEELDVVINYAEHLAAFKMGGAEFAATQYALDDLVRLAQQQNERWRAASKAPGDNMNKDRRDFAQVRRRAHPEPIPVGSDMEGGI